MRDSHLFAVMFASCNGRGNRAAVLCYIPVDYGIICAAERSVRKLIRKRQMRVVVFRNDKQPRCVLIDSVNNPGAENSVYPRKLAAAMIQNRVYKRSVLIACRRVDNHSARLIDNKHVIILINNIERNILRFSLKRLRFGKLKLNFVPLAQLKRSLYLLSVHRHRSAFEKMLCEAPRDGRHIFRYICVTAHITVRCQLYLFHLCCPRRVCKLHRAPHQCTQSSRRC